MVGGAMQKYENSLENRQKSGTFRVMILRKKTLIAIVLAIAVVALCVGGGVGLAATAASPFTGPVVVIDAGHGGIDHGVVGDSGFLESDFNLMMSRELKEFLEGANFKVVMTRETSDGLYGDSIENFKRRDMAARKEIIRKANPDFVISIHANKFPGDSRRGAQVFYDGLSGEGKSLAQSIQSGLNYLNDKYTGKTYSALSGDYYMLKCTQNPSVIVECGFLSNDEDEALLKDAEYRQKLAFAIYSGVVGYLSTRE